MSNSTLYRIVYVSSASSPFSEQELNSILEKSRRNNQKKDVTGMLIYSSGNILQVLEGPKDQLTNLYNIIENDERHVGCIKLQEVPVDRRNFSDWSMGFRALKPNEDTEGFFNIRNADTSLSSTEIDPTLKTILTSFIEDNR